MNSKSLGKYSTASYNSFFYNNKKYKKISNYIFHKTFIILNFFNFLKNIWIIKKYRIIIDIN